MKVAVVTTRHGAQDDRIYYKQAESLAKRMKVIMIAPDNGENLVWNSNVTYRPLFPKGSGLRRFRSLLDATREICSDKPDFCHLHDLDLALAIPIIRLLTGAKIIYDSHEAFPERFLLDKRIPEPFRPFVKTIVDFIEKGLVRFAHQVITADDPTCHSFLKTKLPCDTVFNYPLLKIFDTDEEKLMVVKAKYAGRPSIIYQGTMSEDRGLFHMIDALSIIKKQIPTILLRLVGLENCTLRKEVEKRARAQDLSGEIEIVPWMHHREIAYSLKSSQIGLIPFQPEEKYKRNIPIKIFEYMACGLPIIGADLPPIANFLQKVDAGILYDSMCPEELAHWVLELLPDSERRRRMGENGLRAVRELWNWEKMEETLFGIYDALESGSNKR